MAKELPYFQFEPAEYLTGDIAFCSLSAQGLFINLCSYYWQRQCNLSKDRALKRLNYPNELEELISEGIIIVEGDLIKIKFLDEQFAIATGSKKESSEKGKLGNLKRWHKDLYNKVISKEIGVEEAWLIAKPSGGDSGSDNLAIAKTSHIREDKIREEKINNINSEKVENLDEINRSLVAGEKDIKEIAMELADGNQHGSQREAIMNEHRIKKIEVFKWALSLFNRHKRSLGQLTSTHSNYSFHLNNWLRKQDIQAIHQDYYQEIKRQTEKQ